MNAHRFGQVRAIAWRRPVLRALTRRRLHCARYRAHFSSVAVNTISVHLLLPHFSVCFFRALGCSWLEQAEVIITETGFFFPFSGGLKLPLHIIIVVMLYTCKYGMQPVFKGTSYCKRTANRGYRQEKVPYDASYTHLTEILRKESTLIY